MLQQTQVDRVIGYYNRFLLKYPTIESLAETTYEELFPYYQGLGYYWRARRMIELAKVVIAKYDGIFSDEFEKLRKLPWIGQYTAQALLAFGYDKPALAMDANLEKIFSRYFYGDKNIFWILKTGEMPKGMSSNKKQNDELLTQLEQQLEKENISGREINNALWILEHLYRHHSTK
jgi:adenine-specific DNA glycosylase